MLLPLGVLFACNGADGPKETGVPLEGPVLVHTQPEGVIEGTGLTMAVTATDADAVASVTLFHRVSGETTWVQAPMTQGEDDVWTTELEGTDIDDPALEYYFKAEDAGEAPATSYLPEESTAAPFDLPVAVVGTALPFLEGFEHADGEDLSSLGWGNASVGFRGYGWETSTSLASEGARSVFHSRGHTDATSDMEDWLITPALDFSAAGTAQVTWRERGVNVDEANHGLFVSLGSRDPSDGDYVAVAEALPAPTEGAWGRSAVYDLSAYAGEPTVYLAWRFVGLAADDWYIDDVRVEELQPDLVLGTTPPSPIDPGGSGTFTVTLENFATVDASDLSVVLSFPEGGASVAESSVGIDAIASGSVGTADFTVTVDSSTPDNSYVPFEVTVTDEGSTWSTSGELLVGLASTASFTWTPSAEGAVALSLGVGDPSAPTWEEIVYDGTSADPVALSVDITDQGALLPPAAGELRWFLRVDADVAGAIDDFAIESDGVVYTASVLPLVAADDETLVWLPEPPDFSVDATTSPATLSPGDSGVTLGLSLLNEGAATQGGVVATLTTDEPDVTLHDGGPVAITAGAFGAGATVSVDGAFRFDVAPTHVDSSALAFTLTLDDGVESWDVPLSVDVPYPYLAITDVDIDDDGRDGELDADESADLDLQLTNLGDLSTSGTLTAVLTVEDSSTATAVVSTDPASYSALLAGRSDTPDDPWEITVTSGAEGDTLDLLLTVTDAARTYEARTTVRLGEPPWEALNASGDAEGDVLEGWQFDIVGGQWRVDDGVLQLRLESAQPYDPDTLFIESWGLSTVADWTFYRIVLQSGVATLEGYASGFTTIGHPVASYPSDTVVQLDIQLADMGLALDTFSLGFASGWCGPDEYYCDHFPNGWGYPYDTWNPDLFFDLSW